MTINGRLQKLERRILLPEIEPHIKTITAECDGVEYERTEWRRGAWVVTYRREAPQQEADE